MAVVAVCVRLALVPVIVRVEVPVGVVLPVLTVIVEGPLPVIVGGAKLAEAPVGKPLALKVTVPVNPFNAPMVTVYVVEFPGVTVWDEGDMEMEKSGVTVVVPALYVQFKISCVAVLPPVPPVKPT